MELGHAEPPKRKLSRPGRGPIIYCVLACVSSSMQFRRPMCSITHWGSKSKPAPRKCARRQAPLRQFVDLHHGQKVGDPCVRAGDANARHGAGRPCIEPLAAAGQPAIGLHSADRIETAPMSDLDAGWQSGIPGSGPFRIARHMPGLQSPARGGQAGTRSGALPCHPCLAGHPNTSNVPEPACGPRATPGSPRWRSCITAACWARNSRGGLRRLTPPSGPLLSPAATSHGADPQCPDDQHRRR
jgi:hypothetical protein